MTIHWQSLVDSIEVGAPLAHNRLTLLPLFRKSHDRRIVSHWLLADAVMAKQARVTEVNQRGCVPQMDVVNESSLMVFIPDGMTLVGSKQNRVVNVSLLLEPKSVTTIPVSCVEHGRWYAAASESTPSAVCDPELRRRMCAETARCAEVGRDVSVDQGGVWSHVRQVLHSTRTDSATAAYDRAYEKTSEDFEAAHDVLRYAEGASGVGVLIDGQVRSIDLFDKPATLETLWPRLLRGAVLASLQAQTSTASPLEDPRDVVRDSLCRGGRRMKLPGAGMHQRFQGIRSIASTLEHDDSLIHLAVFGRCPDRSADSPPRENGTQKRRWWFGSRP